MKNKHFRWLIPMVVVLVITAWAFDNSLVPFWERSEYIQAETNMFGIVVHGHETSGWVQNTNSFPVRIRSTWVFRGETDRWIAVLQPGQKKPDVSGHQVLYHVYRLDDSAEMGIVYTEPNGPASPQYRNPFSHN